MNLYKQNTATKQDILSHFSNCDFNPRLETYLDIGEYVEKILTNSERFECWVGDELAGLVAVYCNDLETKTAFITNVSSASEYAGRGIASELLKRAIDHCTDKGFKKINLEVNQKNLGAIHLYGKFGFKEVGKDSEMIKMSLEGGR